MRVLIIVISIITFAMLCSAQTPVVNGPVGKMNPKDLYEPPPMVLIPTGEYEMGDHYGIGLSQEIPVHAVYIDGFYMDTYHVTNKEYADSLNWALANDLIWVGVDMVWGADWSSGGFLPELTYPYYELHPDYNYSRITWDGSTFSVIPNKNNHPVSMVSWHGAVAYANWRSIRVGLTPCYDLETSQCDFTADGYRLATEAEWEKAARGGEYNPYYIRPWGNTIDGSKANYNGSGDPFENGVPSWWVKTTPVKYYNGNQIPSGVDMANGYGLYDMLGNVHEWCNDYYMYNYYQYCVNNNIYFNPKGQSPPISDNFRICRGLCYWDEDYELRTSNRGACLSQGGFPYRSASLYVLLCPWFKHLNS